MKNGIFLCAAIVAGSFAGLASAADISHPGATAPVETGGLCKRYGPQTPRDIAKRGGSNKRLFAFAPPSNELDLCNIHMHTNAEHKGPGFSVSGGAGEHGGWKCNGSDTLTDAELADPGEGAMEGVKPGDTIEVHWVFTSCGIAPGAGLGSCLTETCANPELRVESQVFLVVNDADALDFEDFAYKGYIADGYHQPLSLPSGTGDPVTFTGSTTGPKYTEQACSPMQVTWSVRPECAKVDVSSLHKWAADGNVFGENHSHGVRQLVTAPELLSVIE